MAMFGFTRRASLVAAAALSMLLGAAFSASAEDLPADAQPMTSAELHSLYKNKSWQWETGAGYFNDDGRQFSAVTEGKDGSKSWALGRWIITDAGRMCMAANWYVGGKAYPDTTCFSHRTSNGTIYQRRDPDGAWYIFRHAKPQQGDEANKLVAKDLVSASIAALRAGRN